MSIWNSIMGAIGLSSPAEAATPDAPTAESPTPDAAAATPSSSSSSPVDVEDVLFKLAAQKNGGGNWQSSIVDLLKLLDLDSSLSARKELADELNVHVGEAGTAEENIALHRAVMQKLEENGGRVPDSLKG